MESAVERHRCPKCEKIRKEHEHTRAVMEQALRGMLATTELAYEYLEGVAGGRQYTPRDVEALYRSLTAARAVAAAILLDLATKGGQTGA